MAVSIEDISSLAAYMQDRHGALSEERINHYIEHFRRHGDQPGEDLWLKVFAVRHKYAKA